MSDSTCRIKKTDLGEDSALIVVKIGLKVIAIILTINCKLLYYIIGPLQLAIVFLVLCNLIFRCGQEFNNKATNKFL